MKNQEHESHEIAKILPLMGQKEFDKLKEDINAKGLIEPILLYENKILDGRNRYKACKELSLKPEFDEFKPENGVDPLDFVVSKNLKRRHLNKSQIAMVALDALPLYEKQAKVRQNLPLNNVPGDMEKIPLGEKGKSRDIVGEVFGISGRYVSDAKAIINDSPDLADKIRTGEISIPTALSEIKLKKQIAGLEDEVKSYDPQKDIKLLNADCNDWCEDNNVKDSFDLIVADLPATKDDQHLYKKLGKMAKLVLKAGKFCIIYSDPINFFEVTKELSKHLEHYWTYCLYLKVKGMELPDRSVTNRWTPILIFYKGSDCKPMKTSVDFIPNSGRQKGLPEWQKNVEALKYLIDSFSKPGDAVLDPMCGNGTSIIACKELKRKVTGIYIDEKAIKECKRFIGVPSE